MSDRWPTGTLVQLKSGGPVMTVLDESHPEAELLYVMWFVDVELHRDCFHRDCLIEWNKYAGNYS